MARRDPSAPFCSDTSRSLGEPLTATASRVDEWLLVEWSGAWGRHALTESDLPAPLADRLDTFDRAPRSKAILVRKGFRDDGGPTLVVRARSTVGDERIDLRHADGADDTLTAASAALSPGRPHPARFVAVCTNGRHDACCANQGRPLVRALRARGEGAVWECSHIGGDRFAANVVVLPEGLYFGRVDPDGVASFLSDLERGLLPMEHYRGRSALPPPVQALELAARRRTGERRIDALSGWSRDRAGTDRWSATVDLAGVRFRAEVVVDHEPAPRLLTCHADEPMVPRHFRVGPLATVDPPP